MDVVSGTMLEWVGSAIKSSLHFILEHSDDVICRTRKIKPINHYFAVLLAMLCTGEKCMTSWKEKLSDTLSYLNWFLHMVT